MMAWLTARLAAATVAFAAVALGGAASAHAAETVHLFNVQRLAQQAFDDRVGVLAQLGEDREDGSGRTGVVLRSFDRGSGFQLGADHPQLYDETFRPVDVALARLGGVSQLIVLAADGQVQLTPFRVEKGQISTDPTTTLRLRVDPDTDLRTVTLVPPTPERGPVLAAGGGGIVHLADLTPTERGAVVNHEEQYAVGGAITDLEPVRRDGQTQLAAITDGIMVIAVLREPDRPAITGRFTDPLRERDPSVPPLLDIGGPPATSITDGTSNTLAAANGTANLIRLEVPSTATGSLVVKTIEPVCVPIKQVVVGSLTALAADGSGVAYSRGWTLADPVLGTLWTISGGTAELSPERLNARSRGRVATLRIEVADGRAARIDPATLRVHVSGAPGRSVGIARRPAPALVFHDGDRNPELEVKVDRAALLGLLRGRSGEVPLGVRWRQRDGVPGHAAAVARLG